MTSPPAMSVAIAAPLSTAIGLVFARLTRRRGDRIGGWTGSASWTVAVGGAGGVGSSFQSSARGGDELAAGSVDVARGA
jgi:hypothetical protein